MKIKKAFTLIEILLVVIIVGILVWVLFKVYVTMSQISFRVEQQKIVNQELLFVSELMQNFANRNDIDYTKYDEDLVNKKWISDKLFLTWADGEMVLYTSGDCLDFDQDISQENLNNWCRLVLERWLNITYLTDDLVYLRKALFKIVPFALDDDYITNTSWCESNYLTCINDPWFWFMTTIYSIGYNKNVWANEVSILVQEFFNI